MTIGCVVLLLASMAARDDAQLALERARKAAGGAEKLAAIRDISRTLELTDGTNGAKAERTFQIILPRTILQQDRLVGGLTLVAFSDGKSGVLRSQWGLDDLPGWQLAAARQDAFRQLESLLLSDRDPSRTVTFVGRMKLDGGGEADVVAIDGGGMKVELWIDAESGDLRKMTYPQMTVRGEGEPREDLYDDPKEFDGVRLPSRITTIQSGVPMMESLVKTVRYNTGLDSASLKNVVTASPDSPSPYK